MIIDYNLAEEEEVAFDQLAKKSKNTFANSTELLNYLKGIYHNQSLLKIFLSNAKILDKSCYMALFDLLERNLAKREEAEAQERERWSQRRMRLQKLNPKLDLAFRFEHQTREQVIEDPLFQAVKQMLEVRINNPHIPFESVCDYFAKVLDFEGRLNSPFAASFLEKLSKCLDGGDSKDLAKQGTRISKSLMVLRRMKEAKCIDEKVLLF